MPPRKQAAAVNPTAGPPALPPPALTSLSPSSLAAGSPPATVDVYGSGFESDSVVEGDGAPRVTFYIDGGHLEFTARPDIETGATVHQISVLNNDGQISNVLPLAITGPPSTSTIGFWTCDCGLSISASQPLAAAPICICQRTMYPVTGTAPKTLYDVVFVTTQDQRNR